MEGIRRVHAASVRGMGAEAYPDEILAEWARPRSARDYARSIASNPFLVAEHDGEIIGFAELEPHRSLVRSVYVAPAYARRGIASRLLAGLEEAARGLGLRQLLLGSSLNAVPFYEAAGFIAVKRDKYPLLSGGDMDSVAMRKRLT